MPAMLFLLGVWGGHRAQGALLQPDGIPEGIVLDAFHQACPHWVTDDVSRHRPYFFIMAQGMIMECARPYCPLCMAGLVRKTCAGGLQSGYCAGQRSRIAQLHQPMHMVWHQHPSEERDICE